MDPGKSFTLVNGLSDIAVSSAMTHIPISPSLVKNLIDQKKKKSKLTKYSLFQDKYQQSLSKSQKKKSKSIINKQNDNKSRK